MNEPVINKQGLELTIKYGSFTHAKVHVNSAPIVTLNEDHELFPKISELSECYPEGTEFFIEFSQEDTGVYSHGIFYKTPISASKPFDKQNFIKVTNSLGNFLENLSEMDGLSPIADIFGGLLSGASIINQTKGL